MELDWPDFKSQNWVMKRDNIKVETTYKVEPKDSLSQTYLETVILEVDDHGKKLKFSEKTLIKYVYPQEFLTLIKLNNKFEFVGWFERSEFKKLKRGGDDNIVILRKK
jgi:hypothetical protein